MHYREPQLRPRTLNCCFVRQLCREDKRMASRADRPGRGSACRTLLLRCRCRCRGSVSGGRSFRRLHSGPVAGGRSGKLPRSCGRRGGGAWRCGPRKVVSGRVSIVLRHSRVLYRACWSLRFRGICWRCIGLWWAPIRGRWRVVLTRMESPNTVWVLVSFAGGVGGVGVAASVFNR